MYSIPNLFPKFSFIQFGLVGTEIPVPLSSQMNIIGTCPPRLQIQLAVLIALKADA